MNFISRQAKEELVVMTFLLALGGEATVVSASDVATNLPPPANRTISFDQHIRPILESSCLSCHGAQKPKSRFRLDFRAGALAGGAHNTNDIVPGHSEQSWLIAYVARQVPDMEMPPDDRAAPLTPEQIGLLRAWIDQGANWGATNQSPSASIVFEPVWQTFDVSGNQSKFRELEGTKEGASGGLGKFSATEQISPTEKFSIEGRAIVPNQDFSLKLSLDKDDLGFIHAGFDQWRKYYAADGGFDPAIKPQGLNLDQDLYVDNGRAWVDFGLDLPRWPQIVLGYEYQYRTGTESTLDWGYANGKNIYPATKLLDEHTHIVKLDVTKSLDDWILKNNARIEIYGEKNFDAESAIIVAGTKPDESINTRDNYHHVQGSDAFTIEKPLRDWWLLNGGFYYSCLSGDDFFNQTTSIPAFHFNHVLSSQEVTLDRESEIFSIANLFSPLSCLTLSLGTQNEWTRESGFGESIPDLDVSGNVPVDSSLNEFKASQSAGFRFTKIPFTVIFGDGQLSEDYYTIAQAENPTQFERDAAAENFRQDFKTGFTTSPWRWSDLTTQYERRNSDTDYGQLEDLFTGVNGPTNGYPGFILDRRIQSDQWETKLVLRPNAWLKTTLTYQLTSTDYASKTDPAHGAALATVVSEGGMIADGRYNMQTYGISTTVTPWRRVHVTTAFTYSRSRAITADNGDPSIVPYAGDIVTVYATANYNMNEKTSLQLSYNFSRAAYAENNAAAGIPAGLDYTRHDLIAGLTRRFSRIFSGALRYEFSQYEEPSSGNLNNFTAHGVFATLACRWP